ncbi:MAG: glycoside hydrolase family 3 N-terminal domain-containing protein [Candidatus Gastranaerophilaceae bacterium]
MQTLNERVKSLFIAGYNGTNPENDEKFAELLRSGLGGVIFFTQNIRTAEGFKKDVETIKRLAKTPPLLSIDQEGGRVERTENLHNGKKYLSAQFAAEKGEDFVRNQTEELCSELSSFGINMNFAPVLDVNSNPDNPIIGERAFADNPDDVAKFAKIVADVHKKHGIITVGKHFPGHGDTATDSHVELPFVNFDRRTAELHLKPFKLLNDLPAMMVAHVVYPLFDDLPASLSEKIIKNILRKSLKFNSVVISDDMVMGAVKNIENAFVTGLKAGINMFIYRCADEKLQKTLQTLETLALRDEELLHAINDSYEKITALKTTYNII